MSAMRHYESARLEQDEEKMAVYRCISGCIVDRRHPDGRVAALDAAQLAEKPKNASWTFLVWLAFLDVKANTVYCTKRLN